MSRRRQKEKEEDNEATLSSSRNPKMDLLAAAKMKTTATVTLFLTFLIAVGCSSAESNANAGAYELAEVGVLYISRGNQEQEEEEACKVFGDGVCAMRLIGGVSAIGCIGDLSDPDRDQKITIIGQIRQIRQKLPGGEYKLGTIVVGKHENEKNEKQKQLSIIMYQDQYEHVFGEYVGEYVLIKGEISTNLDRPVVLVSSVYLVEPSEVKVKASEASEVKEVMMMNAPASGEATGSLWIMPGIFSLTVLLAAAVALISWNLQKKAKARNEKTLNSEKLK